MKTRTVKISTPTPKPAKVSIQMEQTPRESWDSEPFDRVVATDLEHPYVGSYQKHKATLIALASSRLALDAAIVNVGDGLTAKTGGAVELASAADTAAFDHAYAMGLRMYVYNHVLGLTILDDDVRKELLSTLSVVSLQRRTPSGTKGTGAMRSNNPVDEMSAQMDAMEARLSKRLGPAQPELKRKPAPRQKEKERRREPVTKRRGRT